MEYEVGKNYLFVLKQTNSDLRIKAWQKMFGENSVYVFTCVKEKAFIFDGVPSTWLISTILDYCHLAPKKYKEMEEWL